MALTDKIKAIADAIRTKTGMTDVMTLDEMPAKISGMPSGAKEPYVEESYDEDGNLITAKLVGHTIVRNDAYASSSNLASIELPSSITSIGARAFRNCSNMILTELPSSLITVGSSAFVHCYKLSLTELPSNLITIDTGAFQVCTGLTSIVFPSSLTTIGAYAFNNCSNLESVRFLGTPTSIDENTFNGCTNLTSIKVPWSEGAMANAPWGATNATIIYNTTT